MVNEAPHEPVEPPWSRGSRAPESDAWGPANLRRPVANDAEPVPSAPTGHVRPRGGSGWRLALVVAGSALFGAVVGGLLVSVFDDNDGGSAVLSEGNANQISVEVSSAITEVAAAARPGVVRVESAASAVSDDTDIGSGVIIDAAAGYVLTNAHVVLDTERLQVVLADGTARPAVLVGHDFPYTDVAILQISPGGLTQIPAGDSEQLRLGETVVAIGNPLAEFDGTVTVGVISGLNRARTYDGVRQGDLIQTDAAVNSGNSGGALLNLQGQLVGIPMSVVRETRGGAPVEGIAFALPANRAMEVGQRIIETGGSLERPTLQLDVVELTPGVRAQFPGIQAEAGALVVAILMNGVAASAGIELADVIVEVDGSAIDAEHPLHSVLARLEPGQSVRVVFNRSGRIIETEVTLAKRS